MGYGEYYDSSFRDEKAMLDIVGATILNVNGLSVGSEEIEIQTDKGVYVMFHSQDCCEDVRVDDIIGTLQKGTKVLDFIVKTNTDILKDQEYKDESFTWTFYTIKTDKGYCDIKWYGCSNGYYSEEVDFYKRNEC